MKNKHGSNVGITLGTVINYNILQHYSISITTLIVYFTHYSILLFFITRYCSFTFCVFTSICSYLALSLLISHFQPFALILFLYLFRYFSLPINHYYSIYISSLHKQLNFGSNWL
jgi:hypothetical protein